MQSSDGDPQLNRTAPGHRGQSIKTVALAVAALLAPVMARARSEHKPRGHQLQNVTISAAQMRDLATRRASIQKLTQPLIDTPQSITTLTEKDLSDRGVTNLNDALRTVPDISLGAGETSWQGNNPFLRGFPTRDDMFVDGQRDYGYYYRDPLDDQSVEVLEGPSSILFGRGTTGGVINEVTKTPSLSPLASATATIGSAEMRRITTDVDSPVSWLRPGAAFRLHAMAHHSKTVDRHVGQSDRRGIAPSLALGLGTPTRDARHSESNATSTRGTRARAAGQSGGRRNDIETGPCRQLGSLVSRANRTQGASWIVVSF